MLSARRAPVTSESRTFSRSLSPRLSRPRFTDGSIIEERDSLGRVLSRYRWLGLLGRGGFAKCYEGVDLDTDRIYAIKVIDRASITKANLQSKLRSEIEIHRRMNHKNIVHFYKTFQDEWYVYIVLEKCSNQTLMELAKTHGPRFSVLETQFFCFQIMEAISYMHKEGVLHRDLKLGNCMLDSEMNIKVGDFGLAAELLYDGERKRTVCGTPNYIAPEILEGSKRGHSYEVDVWSFGCIVYTLLVGVPPFQTSDVKTTYNRIKTNLFSFPPGVTIGEDAKDLIYRILRSEPEKRLKLEEVRAHPFFKNVPLVAPLSLRQLQRLRNVGEGGAVRDGLRVITGNEMNIENGAPRPSRHRPLYDKPREIARTRSLQRVGTRQYDLFAPRALRLPSEGVQPPTQREEEHEEDKQQLTQIHDKLQCTFHNPKKSEPQVSHFQPPPVWVVCYADFSFKYGLAYLLNTGHTAVHYNDSTKMVWETRTGAVEYYARVKEIINSQECVYDRRQSFSISDYPPALQKKITLIKYFRNYLSSYSGKIKEGVEVVNCCPYKKVEIPLVSSPHITSDVVYVKKWLLTDEAMVFRFSNKYIQVCFFDKWEIILPPEIKSVTTTDSTGNRITMSLNDATMQGSETARRLEYTERIILKLMS